MLKWFRSEKGCAPVTLHIYDLGPSFAGPNMVGKAIGTGAYHAGVEVYGLEWSFSCTQDGPYRSGIFAVPPRGCDAHHYREAVEMGQTSMSAREVRALIDRLYREWPGVEYDLLRHNCCHFSDALCIELGVGPIPGWVTSLAGVGAMLRSGIRLAYEGAAAAPGAIAGGALAMPGLVWEAGAAVGGAAAGLGGVFGGGDDEKPIGNAGYPGGQITSKAPRASSTAVAADGQAWTAGDQIEVWSNGHQAWCPGHVEEIKPDNMVSVAFKLPIAEPENMASKCLPAAHSHLRRANAVEQGAAGFAKGEAVEVWSNSSQAWCPGYVHGVTQDMLYLAFRLPGSKEDEWSQKQLPANHKDVRHPPGASRAAGSRASAAPPAAAASAAGLRGPSPPSSEATASAAPAKEDKKKAAAREAASGKIAAALREGNAASVQDACSAAEAVGVDTAEIDAARIKAVIFAAQEELRAARKSEDPAWIEQACRRARDAGVDPSEIEAARAESRKLYARADLAAAVQCADMEIVEEACQLAKEAGLPDAELDKARRDAKAAQSREAAAKDAAAKDTSRRASAFASAVAAEAPGLKPPAGGRTGGPAPFDTGVDLAAPGPPATRVLLPGVGDWVEVYSNTNKVWCLGRVTKVTPEGPSIVFQLPGAGDDDWLEKVVPIERSASLLRRPASVPVSPPGGAGGAAVGSAAPAWSAEERVAYAGAFNDIASESDAAKAGRSANMVNAEKVATFLRGSGLPRKVLKQIWLVANPHTLQELALTEFSICLRLIGHCQAVLTSGDCSAAELLVEGGAALKTLLETDLLHKPPPALARFHGHVLDGRASQKSGDAIQITV